MMLERLKDLFMCEIAKFKQVAYIVSAGFLILRFANDFTPFDNTILSVGLMLIIVIIVSNVYTRILQMHTNQTESNLQFNKYAVYSLSPFERMKMLNLEIPILQSQLSVSHDEYTKELLKQKIALLESWVKHGYIKKSDFPDYLKKYYIDRIRKK